MLNRTHTSRAAEGFTMLEVLIAIVITAFGLLGVASLLSQMQISETETLRDRTRILNSDSESRILIQNPDSEFGVRIQNPNPNSETRIRIQT